ncbi:MAG: fibronectin type III domain-containing protein, partial [Elusimicrobia bacterium]|nr:fibronectin type III domain-containing protein [Elusimicrobiota bacterium]
TGLKFPLEISLSRAVDGRLVDADVFFSKPAYSLPAAPSVTVANAKIYLDYSTAAVDGSPVGKVGGVDTPPGTFKDTRALTPPTGTITFEPESLTAKTATLVAGSSVSFAGSLVQGDQASLTGGYISLIIKVQVPAVYIGGVIRGKVTLSGGSIAKATGLDQWQVTIDGSSQVAFWTSPAVADPTDDTKALATTLGGSGNVLFTSLTGTIVNSSATITNFVDVSGRLAKDLKVTARYTSTVINLEGATYNFDVSTMVVREMIFADDLAYTPDSNEWEIRRDTKTTNNTFTLPIPVFNESVLLTPAADAVLIGGRNCEAAPYADCLRGTKTFNAVGSTTTVYIPSNITGWASLPPLNTKRAFHTSTLLPDDRILTCGGSDGTATLSSCELWNPITKTWEYTGSMNFPRARHTATLLPNGNVLIAGGAINASTYAVRTAEIFYPASGRFSATDDMDHERANHTATLLPDGNVLVAGGNTINGYSDTFEIYFTTMAAWVDPLGDHFMTTPRAQHTATLLKNGNVLLAGGVNGDGALNTAEIFYTATQTRAGTGSMLDSYGLPNPRYAHTANLLRDGRVIAIGGSDNYRSQDSFQLFDGANWSTPGSLVLNRTSHCSVLLPNGKVMVTGGEVPGTLQGEAESYDPDFPSWFSQGEMASRADHTTVLTSSGILLAIGGWNGYSYLNSTEAMYFSFDPDSLGFAPKTMRNPYITGGTSYFAPETGERATLLGNTTNFHGISEASGGGSGSMNSSQHNPRVYIQAVDNPSGYMTDITDTIYGANNPTWENTLSSITTTSPATLPYGYYHMRVAANGQFSNGRVVQVTMPRPAGKPSVPTPNLLSPYWRGTSSITWTWGSNTLSGDVNGYAIYAASNSVFIDTVAFTPTVTYLQDNLSPNTQGSLLVNGYNLGGGGELTASGTYYTLASSATNLTVINSEFTSATLVWDSNGNSDKTAYQITLCPGNDFYDPASVSTAVWFSDNHTETTAVISNLQPSVTYYFRVQAQNGEFPTFSYGQGGVKAAFSNSVSTITVGGIANLSGVAISTAAIAWSWAASAGTGIYFEIYDISSATPRLISSTTVNTQITQQEAGMFPDRPYKIRVNAAHDPYGYGKLRGPSSDSPVVYTLAAVPTAGVPSALVPGTGTITAYWQESGNSTSTVYNVDLSTTPNFVYLASTTYVNGNTTAFPDLYPNMQYYARVKAINGDGVETSSASLGAKYTLAKKPAGVKAVTSLSGVTLSWSSDGNAPDTAYQVRGTTYTDFDHDFVVYKAFGRLYYDTSLSINGLMTDTDYLFDVEALNGDGVPSGTSSVSPSPVRTDPGPENEAPGSIGGTSDPSKDVVISGTLPNGRVISMSVPAGAFPEAIGLSIASSTVNSCGQTIATVALKLYSERKTQPEMPITLSFNYTLAESLAGIQANAPRIVLARFNPDNGDCLPLETVLDTGNRLVTATLNHFSDFQLIVKAAVSDLKSMRVYPNPFFTNRGNGYVTIDPVPANSKIRIYTLSGDKVWEGAAGTTGVIIWKGVNKSGEQVASGIYLAVIDSSSGKKVTKIAVER